MVLDKFIRNPHLSMLIIIIILTAMFLLKLPQTVTMILKYARLCHGPKR